MPPLVDYFILLALMDRAFALNGTGSRYTEYFAWQGFQLLQSVYP
jgi:hypothetical protein